MEIRVYLNMQAYLASKVHFCTRIECPDVFDFNKALDVFKSIYGSSVVVVFFCPLS